MTNILNTDHYKDQQVLNTSLRTNFSSFIQKSFSTITGGQSFLPNWHIDLLADVLERCRKGEIKRLIINILQGI